MGEAGIYFYSKKTVLEAYSNKCTLDVYRSEYFLIFKNLDVTNNLLFKFKYIEMHFNKNNYLGKKSLTLKKPLIKNISHTKTL
jgi:hypothetical protein